MASGKQISFAYGEVSPDLKYKTDSVSFAMGLSKLRNMVVSPQGGVSNRAGFRHLGVVQNLYGEGRRMFKSSRVPGVSDSYGQSLLVYSHMPSATAFDFDKVLQYFRSTDVSTIKMPIEGTGLGQLRGMDAKKASLLSIGDRDLITFGQMRPSGASAPGPMGTLIGFSPGEVAVNDFDFTWGASYSDFTTSIAFKGLAPSDLSVSYMATMETSTGQERLLVEHEEAEGHPHAQLQSSFRIQIPTTSANFKSSVRWINIYRASNKNSIYSFLGRVRVPDTGVMGKIDVTFEDYGSIGDVSRTPPLGARLWSGVEDSTFPMQFEVLRDYKRSFIYQQRHIIIYGRDQFDLFKEGMIGCSKIGAPDMLWMPPIYNASGAFEFQVPLQSGDEALWGLPMERMLIFTRKRVYMIRGGENGILTPTTINPQEILYEGASERVEPKAVGDRGYFVSHSQEKIYRVTFTRDGNAVLDVISDISNHLIGKENIVRMEVTTGSHDLVWLLFESGRLVSIAINGDFFGFSTHDTDGVIKDICVADYQHPYYPKGSYPLPFLPSPASESGPIDFPVPQKECLVVWVERTFVDSDDEVYTYNAVEYMESRQDEYSDALSFMDAFTFVGARLIHTPSLGCYSALTTTKGNNFCAVNYPLIPAQIDGWGAGKIIQLLDVTGEYSERYPFKLSVGGKIFFYYERGGELRVVRAEVVSVDTGIGDVETVNVFSDEDWPEELRDLDFTYPEAYLKATRYVRATKDIFGLDWLAGRELVVYADGIVLTNPLDPSNNLHIKPTWDGSAWKTELPEFVGYAAVGLPYTSEMWTQDLDTTDNRTFTDKGKLINSMGIALSQTRGGYYGSSSSKGDIENMESIRDREDLDFDNTTKNINDHIEMSIPNDWNKKGRVGVKQIDPLPLTVLSIYPKGIIGG